MSNRLLELRRLTAGLLCLLTCSAALLTSTTNASAEGTLTERADRLARSLVSDGVADAAVYAVLDGGKEAVGAHGIAIGKGTPGAVAATTDTFFEIGSITKTFTAVALGVAVQAGRVRLDTPIDAYLPPGVTLRPGVAGKITMEMLATHTAGLPSNFPNDRRDGNGNSTYTLEQFVTYLNNFAPPQLPSPSPEYSNIGFGLLGYVLGQLAGQSWLDLTRSQILSPLGMRDTSAYPDGDPARIADGYDPSRVKQFPLVTPSFMGGGGALRSTASEMLQYLRAQVNQTGLAPELAQAILLSHQGRTELKAGGQQALGWTTGVLNDGRTVVAKGGGTRGFSSFIIFSPSDSKGLYFAVNRAKAKLGKPLRALLAEAG